MNLYGDELAVVVVTYRSNKTITGFLDSLRTATARPVQVVVADNSPAGQSPEQVIAAYPNVTFAPTGGNLGYGMGANFGVAKLGSEVGWIVIANPDVQWTAGAIDALLEATKRWPRGGVFGPLIRESDGRVYPSARQLPSLRHGVGHAILGPVWPRNPWSRRYRQEDTAIRERVAGWLSGSCVLVRREAFDEVGGFNPEIFMYLEDVDLCERLNQCGWQSIYVPDAEITHIGGMSTAFVPKEMLAAHHKSAYHYFERRHPGWQWALMRMVIRAGLWLRLKIVIARTTRPAPRNPV